MLDGELCDEIGQRWQHISPGRKYAPYMLGHALYFVLCSVLPVGHAHAVYR